MKGLDRILIKAYGKDLNSTLKLNDVATFVGVLELPQSIVEGCEEKKIETN